MEPKYQTEGDPSANDAITPLMVIRGGYILLKDPLNRKPITAGYLGLLAIKLITWWYITSFTIGVLYSLVTVEPKRVGRLGRDARVSKYIFAAQKKFYLKNGRFAEDRQELNVPAKIFNDRDRSIIKNIDNQLSVNIALSADSSDERWYLGTIGIDRQVPLVKSNFQIFACKFINKGIVRLPSDVQLKQMSTNKKCPVGTENIQNSFGIIYLPTDENIQPSN
jgi:hypothetical protein